MIFVILVGLGVALSMILVAVLFSGKLRRALIVKHGTTRRVILTPKYAFKFPNPTEWRLFLHGLLANMQETTFSRMKSDLLMPVKFSIPGGWLVIMPRGRPLTEEDHEQYPHLPQWDDKLQFKLPVENKRDSYAWYQGRIVAVDYGT